MQDKKITSLVPLRFLGAVVKVSVDLSDAGAIQKHCEHPIDSRGHESDCGGLKDLDKPRRVSNGDNILDSGWPSELLFRGRGGRIVLSFTRQRSMRTFASSIVSKISPLRSSSLSLPLKDSM